MISIGAVTRLLWVLAILLSGLAFFVHASPNTLDQVNGFLEENAGILTSVGTIVFVGLITIFATHLSNVSSENRERNNRHIAAEIKLSDFRQTWINGLRDDISELSAHLATSDYGEAEVRYKGILLLNRIKLRMNRKDKNYEMLLEAIRLAIAEASENSKKPREKKADKNRELISVSQDVLKSEWERLKRDLKFARIGDSE